jgi:hypothetical protein
MTFASPVIQQNLFGLLERFAELGRSRNLEAVVLFMPRNRLDTESVQTLLSAEAERIPADLKVLDVGAADVDWSLYNLENPADGNICHPSGYGYAQIAQYLAASLQ